jgi:putative phage-type endonuclease
MATIIPHDQGTQEWQEWRKTGLGGSDAPVIMGVSPWNTPYKLWAERCGLLAPRRSNSAMDRGNALEPKIRAQYELIRDLEMQPVCPVEF